MPHYIELLNGVWKQLAESEEKKPTLPTVVKQ
jgi:hypothetical protein